MSFQVIVRDSLGRKVGSAALERHVIENEEYYRKTRIIDQRIRHIDSTVDHDFSKKTGQVFLT